MSRSDDEDSNLYDQDEENSISHRSDDEGEDLGFSSRKGNNIADDDDDDDDEDEEEEEEDEEEARKVNCPAKKADCQKRTNNISIRLQKALLLTTKIQMLQMKLLFVAKRERRLKIVSIIYINQSNHASNF